MADVFEFVPVEQSEWAYVYSLLEVQRYPLPMRVCLAILRKDVGLLFRNA